MSYQYWSLYDDSSCSGAPSGVYVLAQASCSSQALSSCELQYDADGGSIGYVTESCGEDSVSGFADLFDGEPYLAVQYFDDSGCTIFDNTAVYRANGDCANLYAYQAATLVRSATVAKTTGGLVFARNVGNSTTALNCPRGAGPGFKVFQVTSTENSTHECTTFDGVDGGYQFYSTLSASTDSTGSGVVSSGSASTSGTSASSSSSSSTTTTSSSKGSGVSVGLVAGIAAAVLVVIVAIIFCIWKRSKRSGNSDPQSLQDPFIAAHNPVTGGTAGSDPSTLGTGLWNDEVIIAARVPRDQVKIDGLISRGGYGEVYRGTYSHEAVAVKMLFPEVRSDLKKVNAFLVEAKLMAGLSHPHIVRFVGVSWGSLNDLCVLTELMKGGDLRALLKAYDERCHPQGFDSVKIRIAYHVAQALMYLHSLSPVVIHRDLKSKNVLLTTDFAAKLTDFGVSRERQENTMTAGVGTLLWMAPEVMMAEHYSEMADIFSFGVLLSELDLQTLPYSHARYDPMTGQKMPDAVILQKVASGTVQVAFSSACVSSVVQLAKECVSLDPSVRPSAPMVVYRLQTIMKASFRVNANA